MKASDLKSFYSDIYFQDFLFSFSPDQKGLEKLIKDKYGTAKAEGQSNDCWGRTSYYRWEDGKSCIVIWIKDKNCLGTLAHECVHAANYLLEKVGIAPSHSNDEAQSYLVAWIFDKCMEHIKRKK